MKVLFIVLLMCMSSPVLAGTYVEGKYGMFWNVLNHPSPFTASVHMLSMDVGKEHSTVNQRRISVAASYSTGSFNGIFYEQQPGNISVAHYFQGDSRFHSLVAKGHVSLFHLFRGDLFLGATAGGMYMPIQMDKNSFATLVVVQSWGLTSAPSGPIYPLFGTQLKWLKPTVDNSMEWGLVTDVSYVQGWDLMVSEQFVLRYAF